MYTLKEDLQEGAFSCPGRLIKNLDMVLKDTLILCFGSTYTKKLDVYFAIWKTLRKEYSLDQEDWFKMFYHLPSSMQAQSSLIGNEQYVEESKY